MRRGVKAFTRQNLHTKIVVADEWVIAGSANVSNTPRKRWMRQRSSQMANRPFGGHGNSLTASVRNPSDASTLNSARAFTDRPNSLASGPRGRHSQQRAKLAKLWIVKVSEASLPESERSVTNRVRPKRRRNELHG